MPIPFNAEQLAYLKENFAAKPHTHNWDEVIDASDNQPLTEALDNVDGSIDELRDLIAGGEIDEEEDDEAEEV